MPSSPLGALNRATVCHANLFPLTPSRGVRPDPLRVLRAIRFGTRFGFPLHPDILEAASSEQVGEAGSSKGKLKDGASGVAYILLS